jgi:hypothetical protein
LLNRWVLFFCLTIFLSVLSSTCCSGLLSGKNIALGAHYSFAPPAKYEFTRDPTGAVKLTDGKWAFRYFWTDRDRTVGWHRSGVIRIDIDLGREYEYEVHRITFHSARGNHAGVSIPLRVDFYISPDAERYVYAGDVLQGQDVADGPIKSRAGVDT